MRFFITLCFGFLAALNCVTGAEIRSHRGNLWGHPEHTLQSYVDVIKNGAQVVELDIQLTSDGVPVCIHDPTLDRTTNFTGLVAKFTYEQLQQADAGIKFHASFAGRSIPSLQSALELIKTRRAKVIIEPKVNASAAILAAVEAAGFPDDRVSLLLYQPGSISVTDAMLEYHAAKPRWEYWLVAGGTPTALGESQLANLKTAGWDGLSFWPNTFSTADFELAHRLGIRVGVYGVDAANVADYVHMGADLLLTDNPGGQPTSLMQGYIADAFGDFSAAHAIPAAYASYQHDPDADALSNFEEFVYQTNPVVPNPPPLFACPSLHIEPGEEHTILSLTLPRQEMECLWVALEQSPDLVTWRPADTNMVEQDHSRWPADANWRFRVGFTGTPSRPSAYFRPVVRFFPQP